MINDWMGLRPKEISCSTMSKKNFYLRYPRGSLIRLCKGYAPASHAKNMLFVAILIEKVKCIPKIVIIRMPLFHPFCSVILK
ncbi:hypothetical protein D3C73_1295210 [compost metagenome]